MTPCWEQLGDTRRVEASLRETESSAKACTTGATNMTLLSSEITCFIDTECCSHDDSIILVLDKGIFA
jgi:hypothetical protein